MDTVEMTIGLGTAVMLLPLLFLALSKCATAYTYFSTRGPSYASHAYKAYAIGTVVAIVTGIDVAMILALASSIIIALVS